jgi:hypothetical protein
MFDEQRVRESLLKAAADLHRGSAYGDELREVLAGRKSLRQFAAAEAVADKLGEGLDAVLEHYAQRGEEDVEAVRRAFHPQEQEHRPGPNNE